MPTLFDDLKTGLEQAIDITKRSSFQKSTTITIAPVHHYTKEEIKTIRTNNKLTQKVFAEYMGVSRKTVEAWEQGYAKPSGPACRLLSLIRDGSYRLPVIFIQ